MPPSADHTRAVAALRFRALGDETRLRILEQLVAGERSVSDLIVLVDVGQSLMSHHLRILREAGLVETERRGTWAYYRLVPGAIARLHGVFEPVGDVQAAA